MYCVQNILSEGLDIDLDGEFEISRAHGSLAHRPNNDQLPRLVLGQICTLISTGEVLKVVRE